MSSMLMLIVKKSLDFYNKLYYSTIELEYGIHEIFNDIREDVKHLNSALIHRYIYMQQFKK